MYHYIQTESQLWTVGTGSVYDKTWTPESDHDTPKSAAQRCVFLNGNGAQSDSEMQSQIDALLVAIRDLTERVDALESVT